MSIADYDDETALTINRYHAGAFAGLLAAMFGSLLLCCLWSFGPSPKLVLACIPVVMPIGMALWRNRGRVRPWWCELSPLFPRHTGFYVFAAMVIGAGITIFGTVTFLGNQGWPIDWNLVIAGVGVISLGGGLVSLAAFQILFNLKYDLTLAHLNLTLMASPQDHVQRQRRIMLYLERGDFREAIDDCSEWIRLCPREPHLYSARARCFAELEEHDAGLADLETFVTLTPRKQILFFELARWLPSSDSFDVERADWDEAILHNGQKAPWYCGRAALEEGTHQLTEALADYQKAAELVPTELLYHYDLAIVLADLGRTKESQAEIERIRELMTQPK